MDARFPVDNKTVKFLHHWEVQLTIRNNDVKRFLPLQIKFTLILIHVSTLYDRFSGYVQHKHIIALQKVILMGNCTCVLLHACIINSPIAKPQILMAKHPSICFTRACKQTKNNPFVSWVLIHKSDIYMHLRCSIKAKNYGAACAIVFALKQ